MFSRKIYEIFKNTFLYRTPSVAASDERKIDFFGQNSFHKNWIRQQFQKSTLFLKELQNCILRIIRIWSLFCSIWIYASLHFLLFLLENYFFVFLRLLHFLLVLFGIRFDLHELHSIFIIIVYIVGVRYSVFVLTL